jgi:hypothetical protein
MGEAMRKSCPGRESNPDYRAAQARQRPAKFTAQIQRVRNLALVGWWSRSTGLPPILPQICHKFSMGVPLE